MDTGHNKARLPGLPWAWAGTCSGPDIWWEFRKCMSPSSTCQPSLVTNCHPLPPLFYVLACRLLNPFLIFTILRYTLRWCCHFKLISPSVSVWILTWTQGIRNRKHYGPLCTWRKPVPRGLQWYPKGWGSLLTAHCCFFSVPLPSGRKTQADLRRLIARFQSYIYTL